MGVVRSWAMVVRGGGRKFCVSECVSGCVSMMADDGWTVEMRGGREELNCEHIFLCSLQCSLNFTHTYHVSYICELLHIL